jgi:hypothetical protein
MPAVQPLQGPNVREAEAPALTRAPSADAGGFQVALTRAARTVAPEHTPLGGDEAASALSSAYESVTGHAPTAKQLSLLAAQWSLETGGGRAMMNYNFGGIKGQGPSGLSTSYTTKEGHGATERTLVDRFRAYGSATEGATDYLRTLRGRFPQAFEAVKSGDATGFAHALKREGYYTGSEADYTRAVASMSSRAMGQGFATLGQSGSPHAPPVVAPASSETDPTRVLDAMAMADHMTQSALQILGKPDGADDRDAFASALQQKGRT